MDDAKPKGPKVTITHADPGGVFTEMTIEGSAIVGTRGKPKLRVAREHLNAGRWTDAIREAQTPCEVYTRQLLRGALEHKVSDAETEIRRRRVRSWMLHPKNKNLRVLYEDMSGQPATELPGWSDGRLTTCVKRRHDAAHNGVQFGEDAAREVIDVFDALVSKLEAVFATS